MIANVLCIVSQSDHSVNLDEFNHLQTFDVLNAYLYGLIHRYTEQQGDSSKRKSTFLYFVRLHGKEVNVCLKAFMGYLLKEFEM